MTCWMLEKIQTLVKKLEKKVEAYRNGERETVQSGKPEDTDMTEANGGQMNGAHEAVAGTHGDGQGNRG